MTKCENEIMRNVRMGAAAGLSYPALHCVKAQPKGGKDANVVLMAFWCVIQV